MPTELDAVLPEILRYAPNCCDPLAYACIIKAARRICETGLLWRCTETILIEDPEQECLCNVADADIIRIEEADIDGGCRLEPVTRQWLDDHYPRWDRDTEASTARYITQMQPNSVAIYPRQTGTLTARFVLKPSRYATSLPSFLVDQYFEQLGAGAAGEVLIVPDVKVGKPDLGVGLRARIRELALETERQGSQGAATRSTQVQRNIHVIEAPAARSMIVPKELRVVGAERSTWLDDLPSGYAYLSLNGRILAVGGKKLIMKKVTS